MTNRKCQTSHNDSRNWRLTNVGESVGIGEGLTVGLMVVGCMLGAGCFVFCLADTTGIEVPFDTGFFVG